MSLLLRINKCHSIQSQFLVLSLYGISSNSFCLLFQFLTLEQPFIDVDQPFIDEIASASSHFVYPFMKSLFNQFMMNLFFVKINFKKSILAIQSIIYYI
ncbi:unnamed protein product [Paramecium sonneborni]|uniref:Transmembrane protein n=1 Tax=Paramecium sonneborni TaxID=65129 RepID=A0A8S1QWM0_9CILI|nr:unnamed protein product [Paramecium sonneborni]